MYLLHASPRFSAYPLNRTHSCSSYFSVRSSLLPIPEKARYYRHLEAAVGVVEKACRLCVDVKKSLFSGDGKIIEKNDQTPATVADFSVQALISLELSREFPSIPLVAEEDSGILCSNSVNSVTQEGCSSNFLVKSVLNAVSDRVTIGDRSITQDDILEAIDRGGRVTSGFGAKPATYWILDPIDGTRGFLKGNEALYVVGLALVVDGEIALGVMGCPNWKEDILPLHELSTENLEDKAGLSGSGVIVVAHVGYGTWRKSLSDTVSGSSIRNGWARCFVDSCCLVHEARFCIPESQTWESLPLFSLFNSTTDADKLRDKQEVLLLSTCCGSLCKYLMVASGRASVFILRARLQSVIKAWDHAVGIICVHEAGGQVTDWRGSQIDLAADQAGRRVIFPSDGVLITNGNLHNQILEMISAKSSVV